MQLRRLWGELLQRSCQPAFEEIVIKLPHLGPKVARTESKLPYLPVHFNY